MGSLLSEYRTRHKVDFVWAAGINGVCFFAKGGRPHSICLVSDLRIACTRCTECLLQNKETSIVEFVSFDQKGKLEIFHNHMPPNLDLNILAEIHAGESCQAFTARSSRDLEAWLWVFFLEGTKPIRGKRWQSFRRGQRGGRATKAVEQMMWVALHYPVIYQRYYSNFYQSYLLGRNYLLYR
jgi:hypothetical protein